MNKILIPTDFSEGARSAALYALALFGEQEYQYFLTNAFEVVPHENPSVLLKMMDDRKLEVVARLEEEKKEIEETLGDKTVKLECLAEVGPLANVVDFLVKKYGIDFIVMGTKGASGLKEVLIGSNTYDVIHEAICPVIAVPESARVRPTASLVFASDLTDIQDLAVLDPMRSLARQLDAQVQIVTVVAPEEGSIADQSLEREALNQYFGTIKYSLHRIVHESIHEGLDQFVQAQEGGLLVVLAREKDWFERIFARNLTRKIALHTTVPLFVLRG